MNTQHNQPNTTPPTSPTPIQSAQPTTPPTTPPTPTTPVPPRPPLEISQNLQKTLVYLLPSVLFQSSWSPLPDSLFGNFCSSGPQR